ncbi:hypothetical protein C1J03_23790 (plasmid) [Sulfitobacter sp. SK012]|uniref:hypothetical protein n=1 Tax=Sulfitobacter sp. SK012 TaxID=1389005 RepID=UPI000E0C5BBC|nr:hypothetical protein [Sulfitobacter sp. SK012]AXI49138.1 hypothetical protein C1J03_23790 [Sulfitobacter sp. SK012]
MEQTVRPGLRILVGAGCFIDAAAALRIVARLPGGFLAGLGGVLVEESDMLATCQIPRQLVVSASGATAMAPSLSQVRALLKSDARAFQKSLARTADPTGAGWVFAQDKGELVGTALRAAAGWDVLVIGYRQVHQIPGKIVILESASSPRDAVTAVSDRVAKNLSADRVVFSVDHEGDKITAVQPSDTFQFKSLDQALKALTRTNAQAVLVDLENGPVHKLADLARLLEVARCPLVVFGTSGLNTLLEHSTQIPPRPNGNGQNDTS